MRKSLLMKKGVACLLSAAMVFSVPFVGNTVTAGAEDAGQAPDITTGLVGYYTFEDSLANSAPGVADGAVAKLHGGAGDTWGQAAAGSATYADGQHGKAFSFTGDEGTEGTGDDANKIPDTGLTKRGEGLELDVKTGSSFTISAWVKTEQKYNYQPIFFTNVDGDNYVTAGTYYNNFASGGIVVNDTIWSWLDKNNNSTSTLKDMNKNEWTHVVLTFEDNGANKAAAKLYYNAEVLSSQPDIKGKSDADFVSDKFKEMPIYLGVNWWNNSFKGLMDDVRVYNRALTDDDVAALYKEDAIAVTSANITGDASVTANKIYVTQEDLDSNAEAGSFESSELKLTSVYEPANATGVTTKWSVAEADSAKATIADDGTVTLKEAANNGDTIKIVATLTDVKGTTVTAEKEITANVGKEVQTKPVTDIEIAEMSIATEYVNDGGVITNKYAPAVTYTPTDAQIKHITYTVKEGADVVAVDGEKLIPLKAGTATVTAVSKSNKEVTKDFTVTVTDAVRPKTSFNTTAGWTEQPHSGYEKHVGDFDITYSFKNASQSTNAWDNFLFQIINEKNVFSMLRADRYNFGDGLFNVSWGAAPDWTNFSNDMKDANVVIHAVREGDKLTVDYDITASGGTNYKMTATCTGKDVPETLFTRVTGENVNISDLTLKSNVTLTGEHFTSATKSVASDIAAGTGFTFKLPEDLKADNGYKITAVKYAGEALTADAEGNYKVDYDYTKGTSSVKVETEAIPYHIAEEGRATFQYGTIDAVDTAKNYFVGDEVTIVTTPNAGFTSNITVTYMDGTEKKTVEITKTAGDGGKEIVKFKMPAADVTITYAEFTGITRDAIQAAIAAAKTIVDAGNATGKYTEVTWNAFKKAYDAAVAAEANTSASQADLTAAQKALEDAQKALAFAYKVELSEKELSMTVGDKKTLTATVTTEAADKTVKWASSNDKAAKVSATGEVEAVAAGEANITATAADGTAATCKVTVKAAGGNDNPGGTTDEETLTGTAWWTGNKVGKDYELKGDGSIKLNVNVAEAYNNETAFNAELVGTDAAGKKYYLTTGSDINAWTAEGSEKIGTVTMNPSELNSKKLVVGHTYSITVTRKGQDFTVKYYDETAKEDYFEVVWTGSNMPETVNLHIIAQLGTFKVSKATDGSDNPGGGDNPGGDDKPDVTASLKLSKSKATLYTGKASNKTTVKATVSGASKTVSWKSSKPKVAKVSKTGSTVTITAVGKGTTTITATANGIKKTVKITVKNPTITVKNGKKKVGKSLNVKKKKAVKLTITTSPKKAGATLAKLSKKNKKVLTASLKKGKLTIKGKKKGTVTLSIKSGKATKKIKVKVK